MTEMCSVKSDSDTGYGANVFVVETPLQLLNAIEAKHVLQLKNNHLVVRMGGTGFSPKALQVLANLSEWDTIHYLSFQNSTIEWESKVLGSRLSEKLRGAGYEVQQMVNRNRVNRLAAKFRAPAKVFLGNYLRESTQTYMRHFANRLKCADLYLLDDGTDVLLVSEARRNRCPSVLTNRPSSGIMKRLRHYLADWDKREAARVTFFTAYELEVAGCDTVIKNDYQYLNYLRKAAGSSGKSEEVYFLGECLVEDRYVDENYYLGRLKAIKNYYIGKQLIYVPHPRQAAWLVGKIQRMVGIEVRRFILPIECEVALAKSTPAVIASFFCSALQSCKTILGREVTIHAFYIDPENIHGGQELVREAYRYFELIADSTFSVIKLY